LKSHAYSYLFIFSSLLVMALACAPHSCEWGNTVFFFYGCFIFLLLFFMPFFYKELNRNKKIARSLGVSLLAIAFWLLLFMICDFRIMCRLF
jgi:hypothetical protein